MEIKENISLKNYNTFGIDTKARFFCEITSIATLKEAISHTEHPHRFLISGGSNMLLTKDINALVLFMNIKGIERISESEKYVTIKVMAGENWHDMVLWTLDQNYGGLENLSFIPGNTGTAPIQNIGAYGAELKDTFESCEALHISSLELHTFSAGDCNFGYRDSYFKNIGKGKYIITSVILKLTKAPYHVLNTSYGIIETELSKKAITDPTIRDISDTVIRIRQSKLPDPKQLGNSGSFFKNPIIDQSQFDLFIKKHKNAPFYTMPNNRYKIPAGWLIEQCGYKGKRYGDAGIHENQALVLVNYGKATGEEIMALAKKIIKSVYENFGIYIEPEVNIIK